MIIRGIVAPPLVQYLYGNIDLYCQGSRWIARKWPVQTHAHSTAGTRLTHTRMRQAQNWVKALPTNVRQEWKKTITPFGRTYRDVQTKTGLRMAYRKNFPTQPDPYENILYPFPEIHSMVLWTPLTPPLSHFSWKVYPPPGFRHDAFRWWVLSIDRDPSEARFYFSYQDKQTIGKAIPRYECTWDHCTELANLFYSPVSKQYSQTLPGRWSHFQLVATLPSAPSNRPEWDTTPVSPFFDSANYPPV